MFVQRLKDRFSRPHHAKEPVATSVARVPNIFHFCFGLQPDATFGFLEYLAVKSAYEVNRPERIFFHCQHEPSGQWWEKTKGIVTLNRIEAPAEVFGRPLHHYAHRADIVRLMAILEHGGIYLDIDTLCIRPFADLRTHECVMGKQAKRHGLCNAVILSEPRGAFVAAWLDTYRTFRSTGNDKYWCEHSVDMPATLSRRRDMRHRIKVLDERKFFFPLWSQMHHLFESEDESVFQGSYCVHYWESLTRERWLNRITPENASKGTSNFSRFVRRVL
jgi:hypothetical protein